MGLGSSRKGFATLARHCLPFASLEQLAPGAACRLIFVTNHLPLKVSRDEVSGWSFEWDPDALVLQAKEGLPDDMDAVYVGCLPMEIEGREQEVRSG